MYRPRFLGQITPSKLKPPVSAQGVVLTEPEARSETLNITTEGGGQNANVQLYEVPTSDKSSLCKLSSDGQIFPFQ